jgi:PhnB protein
MTSIEPELWVDRAREAISFYEAAFGAWISTASADRPSPRANRGATGRVLLVVDDPPGVIERAVSAGARELAAVSDEHGWQLGRIVDPFGHEWEVGRPLGDWPPPR